MDSTRSHHRQCLCAVHAYNAFAMHFSFGVMFQRHFRPGTTVKILQLFTVDKNWYKIATKLSFASSSSEENASDYCRLILWLFCWSLFYIATGNGRFRFIFCLWIFIMNLVVCMMFDVWWKFGKIAVFYSQYLFHTFVLFMFLAFDGRSLFRVDGTRWYTCILVQSYLCCRICRCYHSYVNIRTVAAVTNRPFPCVFSPSLLWA